MNNDTMTTDHKWSTIQVPFGGWEDDGPDSAPRARLFGALVSIASDVVKSYHSDLYRDASIIREMDISEGRTYWFICREYGTHLVSSRDLTDHPGKLTRRQVMDIFKGDEMQVWRIDCLAVKSARSFLLTREEL